MFNEKEIEKIYDKETRSFKELPVWQSPKYKESKENAIKFIKESNIVNEGDFWILMNETKNGKMGYTGLIISHNGCLKINDSLAEDKKFKPSCLKRYENGYNGSFTYEYCNDEQGIYEVGEVNAKNCKNDYPYAMALKRCFDRVVLKVCKLAYAGIYSDSEAEEFKEPQVQPQEEVGGKYTFKNGKYAGKTIEYVGDYLIDYAYLEECFENEKCPKDLKDNIKMFLDGMNYWEIKKNKENK